MRYTTELMQKILTSPEAQKIIGYVSPIYGHAYVGLWLFQVIGLELDNLKNGVNDILNQAFPQTATWGIKYWEQEYGITPPSGAAIDLRRRNVLLKIQQRAPASPYRIELMVGNAAGAPAKVTERTAVNTFTVTITALPQNIDSDKVRSVIEQIKPAHLIYNLQFVQGMQISEYTGCFMRTLKKQTIRQAN